MVSQNLKKVKFGEVASIDTHLPLCAIFLILAQNLEYPNTNAAGTKIGIGFVDSTGRKSKNQLNSKKQVAVLVLSRLRPDDEGIYKCRADFKRSPTKNNRMYLDVLSKYFRSTNIGMYLLSVLELRYMRSSHS